MEVFFLFFEKANYACAQAVMRELYARRTLRPVFVKGFDYKEHVGSIGRLTPQERFETLDIADFFDSPMTPAAADTIPFPDLDSDGSFESELVRRLVRMEVGRPRFQAALQAYQKVEDAIRALVAQRRPRVAVLPEDTDYARGRLAARAFKALGITVVTLCPSFYNMFVSYPLTGRRYGDHYMVGNRAAAERLLRVGVAEKAIHVVGNPGFDELRAVRPCLGRPDTFLFAGQGLETDGQVLEMLLAAFARRPAYSLLVKPHPDAGAELLSRLPACAPNIRAVLEPWTASQTLERVGCVIAQTSTLLYQAMAVGVPVIVARRLPGPLEINLPREVADGAVAGDLEGFERLIPLAAERRLPQASPEWVQPPGFRAAYRAATLLEEICADL